jgi:copper chaperone CopZ
VLGTFIRISNDNIHNLADNQNARILRRSTLYDLRGFFGEFHHPVELGGAFMEIKSFDAPALFGDHHVSEVRRILMEMPGVSEVYASSAFQVIQVSFDPTIITAEKIETRLQEAGYLGEIPMLVETGVATEKKEGDAFFRHTAVYETVRATVSFAQRVDHNNGRALWPCPGLGAVKMTDE